MQNINSLDEHDKKIHLAYPDLIRSIAIFLVILIHIASGAFYTFSDRWMIANVYDSFGRIAVPLFFMLSGALLLPKDETLSLFFRKRFWKVLLPLIIWSYLYIIWRVFYQKQAFLFSTLTLTQPVYYHLGFIYLIVSVYLATPILRKFYHASPNSLKIYYIIFAFFAAGFLPLLSILLEQYPLLGFDLSFFNGWIGYFILGMFLTELKTKRFAPLFFLLYCLGSILTALLTYWWSQKQGKPNELFYIYLSPNIVIAAIGLFCFLKSFEENIQRWHPKLKKILARLSEASFGIYLIHPMILDLFSGSILFMPLNAGTGNPYLFIPLIALICLILAFSIIFLIQKLPLIKHIAP